MMLEHVKGRPGLDDPIWGYLLETRLLPYLPYVREWWANIENFTVEGTGTMLVPDAPPGLSIRFTRTAVRSPIKGVQAFPFVPAAYLQITGVQGGSTKMIARVCADNLFKMEEFTIVCKSHLPSTYQQGQFLAFIPTEILEDTSLLGQWFYLNHAELAEMVRGKVPESVIQKGLLKL